jgi:hypothetical protein
MRYSFQSKSVPFDKYGKELKLYELLLVSHQEAMKNQTVLCLLLRKRGI